MTNYHYRTRTQQTIINIKTSLTSMVNKLKEVSYQLGVVEAPEVNLIAYMSNRQLPAQVNR